MARQSFKSLSFIARTGTSGLLAGLLLTSPGQLQGATSASPDVQAKAINTSRSAGDTLEPGKPRERKIAGGESHLYEVQMTAEQFGRIVVDQRGIDVALALFGPDGRKIRDINNKLGERGSEAASLIANEPGIHRIEVSSLRKTDQGGGYQIRIEELHPATDQDRATNKAERLVAEANALGSRPTKELLLQAIAKYKESLLLLESAGDLQMKAVVLNRIGRNYFSLGEYRRSLDYHNQALPLTRSAADAESEAATLTYAGDAYRLLSENASAVSSLSRALEGWQLVQDRRGEVEALNVLARVYYQMGDLYKALTGFDRALELSRILADQNQEVFTLSGMGGTYYALGENERAAEIWKQSLALARTNRQQGMEVVMLGKLGATYNALGDKEQALAYLNQTVKLARERADREDEAAALQTMGRVYRSAGEYQKSIELLEQSLVLLKGINSPNGVARAHYNLGKVYTDLGQYQKALDYLNQALVVWKLRDDPLNIAATIRELARAERGLGHLETALAQSEAALNLMEWIRSRAGGQEQRASYLALVQDCFELRIDVLTRLHKLDPSRNYAAAALGTSESARARSLLETLSEAGVDLRQGVDPNLLERERTITEALRVKATEQILPPGNKSADWSLEEVSKEIKDLTAQYEVVQAQIRAASPHHAELIQPRPLNLAEIRERVIDDQTLLLEYYLGQERSYLWAVTSTSIQSYELPKRAEIETAARRIYELLTARNRRVKFETADERRARIAKADTDYSAAARGLSQMVLGPVAGQLGHRRLLIVSDGALQYVPFAALPIPTRDRSSSNEALTVTNEVVSLPSASMLAVLRRTVAAHQPAVKTIAVLADPVFNVSDQRVRDFAARTKSSPSEPTIARMRRAYIRSEVERSASESGWDGEAISLARLPFTRREAEVIAALVPAAYRMQDLDFAASRSNATSADLSQYRIVHFATHGFLNSRHPELSGLVFSLVDEKGNDQNGFLRAHEIYDLRIPAELVVLSGCRTGLGKEIKGEGLVGLTRAFMHAGAARVLVSLWDVHDEATAELMTRFYRHLLGPEKLSPAAALHAAQVSMTNDKRWSAPYYWAGFILQGEPH